MKLEPRHKRRLYLTAGAVACIALCALKLMPRGRLARIVRAQRSALRQLVAEGRMPANVTCEDGQVIRTRDAARMVMIPEGEFRMGGDEDPDEQPIRSLYLSAYLIDRCEVTNRQFKQFVDVNPQWASDAVQTKPGAMPYLPYWRDGSHPPKLADHPVHHVTWEAADAYAKWVGGRLPSEPQWEKAARGGLAGKAYPWGDEPDPSMANWGRPRWPHLISPGMPPMQKLLPGAKLDNPSTTPVGAFPPNGYGLHDMAGNVWEWCEEWSDMSFLRYAPYQDPRGPDRPVEWEDGVWMVKITARSVRGGSWYRRPFLCRCANRSYDHFALPIGHLTDYYYGFRCVVEVKGE